VCNGDTTRPLRPAQQRVDAIWTTTRQQLRRRRDRQWTASSLRSDRRRPVRGTGDADRRSAINDYEAVTARTRSRDRRYANEDRPWQSNIVFGKCHIDLYIHVHFAVFVSYIRVRLITSCRRIANARLCSCVICVNRGVLSIGGC